MDASTLLLFLYTTAIIIMIPGAASLTIAGQGASYGLKGALFGIFGIMLANTSYFILAASGLASLLLAAPQIFTIITWGGVLYLIWLGILAFSTKFAPLRISANSPTASKKSLFIRGYLVEISNPKALFYITAILPPFINVDQPIAGQFAALWFCVMLLDSVIYSLYGVFGKSLAKKSLSVQSISWINRAFGVALIAIALQLAISHHL